MTEQEQQIVGIIASSGQSKSKAFEALNMVKIGEYEKARQLIEESRKLDVDAHLIQTQLIQAEFDETKDSLPFTLLMVHAQDHYMVSQLARDLIESLINVFEAKERGE